MTEPVYVLGGLQTDFARNWAREGLEIADAMREIVRRWPRAGAARAPRDVEVGARRQFRRRAVLQPGSPRRRVRRSAPGPRRRARGAARGRVRIGQPGAARGDGGPRSRALRARGRGRHRADAQRARRAGRAVHRRPGHVVRPRVPRRALPVAARVQPSSATSTSAATGCATSTWRGSPRSTSPTPGATRTRRRAAGRSTSAASRRTTRPIRSSRAASASRTAARSPTAQRSCSWPARRGQPSTPRRADWRSRQLPRIRGWGHRTAPITYEAKVQRERRPAVRVSGGAPRDHRCVPARGRARRRGSRRHRDARLLHHHRIHGDRPLRHHAARARAGGRSRTATSRSAGGSR